MRHPPGEDDEPRAEAQAQGLKQYAGHECQICGSRRRFVGNNACVTCKMARDRVRYFQTTNPGRRYLEEDGDCRISDKVNRDFLSALAKEKAGWPD